ncbi:hypothetical protein EIP91_007155 [Steccherinum ochraceum]|uniref:Protein kinase domain-containing protein n=1 Tax=Steccherinum ochraceum TaxID=92696 RepID=A0A4R0RQT1_9APHY|nr:hypothetical protein EIP91_007155 [Steccherinum ochraceum]
MSKLWDKLHLARDCIDLPDPAIHPDWCQCRLDDVWDALFKNDTAELLSLSGERAQYALDVMWQLLELDRPLIQAHSEPSASVQLAARRRLRRLILKLSISSNKLPSALLLSGVQCSETSSRGVGGFADVFYGTFAKSTVAIKRLRTYTASTEAQKAKLKQAGLPTDFCREALLWKGLKHPHIVSFTGVSEDVFPLSLCMVMPWMKNGSIRDYMDVIERQGMLSEDVFLDFVHQCLLDVASGLTYLHSEGIVHGDLHGGNLLVDDGGKVRLTDFGMALLADATAYNYASVHGGGATRWTAPELIDPEEFNLLTRRPTYQSDVYAFGCTCIELYTRTVPYAELDVSDHQIPRRVMKGVRPARPTLSNGDQMSDPMWSLVTACWERYPSQRLSSKKLLRRMKAILSHDDLGSESDSLSSEPRAQVDSKPTEDIQNEPNAQTVAVDFGSQQSLPPSFASSSWRQHTRAEAPMDFEFTSRPRASLPSWNRNLRDTPMDFEYTDRSTTHVFLSSASPPASDSSAQPAQIPFIFNSPPPQSRSTPFLFSPPSPTTWAPPKPWRSADQIQTEPSETLGTHDTTESTSAADNEGHLSSRKRPLLEEDSTFAKHPFKRSHIEGSDAAPSDRSSHTKGFLRPSGSSASERSSKRISTKTSPPEID